MNELLPYEHELAGKLADIPLPDENQAWDAMRKMLDDDDDDAPPPPVFSGCRNWGIAGIVVLLTALVTIIICRTRNRVFDRPTNKNEIEAKGLRTPLDSVVTALPPVYEKHAARVTSTDSAGVNMQKSKHNKVITDSRNSPAEDINTLSSGGTTKSKLPLAKGNGIKRSQGNLFVITTKGAFVGSLDNAAEKNNTHSSRTNIVDSLTGVTVKSNRTLNKPRTEILTGTGYFKQATPVTFKKSDSGIVGKNNQAKDTGAATNKIIKKADAGTVKKDSSTKNIDAGEDENVNKIYFSAGLGMQQLIPVDGQKATPYNAFGRKGSLADYIPSAYFRVHRNNAFLQIEFKYGAPQYTKNIAYSTKILNTDTFTHITTSAVNHVQKTYYHQLPLSVHYNILPNFSVGAGAVLNKFQSAVVNQQTLSTNGLTGADTVVSNKVVSVKNDSAFAKVYWQFMLETQYAWKRLSFGARYSWGLTPYLIYTPPTGQTQKERNASLNIFLRYELWQPKKK